jgi:hypothetical protein
MTHEKEEGNQTQKEVIESLTEEITKAFEGMF